MFPWLTLIASIFLATFPVAIWIKIIFKEDEKELYIKTFLIGTLSVIPPFILIYLFNKVPSIDIYEIIQRNIVNAVALAFMTNGVVGIVEEIAKNVIVRVIDRRHPEYIQTISSALKLSICAGLGFAFAENIFYFYNIWTDPDANVRDIFATFVFRSMFTMCGHMVFSGIFGYYFGIGKFSADITEFARWENKASFPLRAARFISRLTGRLPFEIIREFKNMQGLLIAMGMHATFNASLDLEHKLPSIMIVLAGALYIAHLLQTKSGHLLFSMTKRRASTMGAQDEDVVIELLGMWTNQGRFKEVIDICDRLLARDPDNNVVKLFQNFYGARQNYLEKQKTLEKAKTDGSQNPPGGPALKVQDEKVVLELMDMYFKEKKYKEVLDVANRLMARNPDSTGAKMLLEKALNKEQLEEIFNSLGRLFQPSGEK
ncbi:PrsW family intramembrane metalloprotease [Candidatus Peregrinibacteria bacterium]|nr:PrsW family intramembrane metalloprotease [Candidatus Peregrinibacteria bacterium]